MDATSPMFLAAILVLASLSSLGSNTPKDVMNALQVVLTRTPNCSTSHSVADVDCCRDCVGLGDLNYNVLFGLIFLGGIISQMSVGLLMDKLGNSVIVLTLICAFTGTCSIAFGSGMSHSRLLLPCMFVGGVLFGLGRSCIVSRDRVILSWFRDRWIGAAIGFVVFVNRLSALIVFALSSRVRDSIGLQRTLWLASLVSLMALAASVGVSVLDVCGARQLQVSETLREERKSMRITDVRKFSLSFWLLLAAICTKQGIDNLMLDNLTEFCNENFHLSIAMSGIVGGSIRFIGFVASPAAGFISDLTGRSFLCLLVVSCLQIPLFTLMAFSTIHPVVTVPPLGFCFSSQYVLVVAVVGRLVPRAVSGTALSITLGMGSVGTITTHLIAGAILGPAKRLAMTEKLVRWRAVMVMSLSFLIVSALLCIAAYIADRKQSSSDKDASEYQELQETQD